MNTHGAEARTAILKVLSEIREPAGATRIGVELGRAGINLSPRTVRFHLRQLDEQGLTELISPRAGRVISEAGREELAHANIVERVGFIDARVDELAYQMDFSFEKSAGTIIMNTAVILKRELSRSLAQMEPVFEKDLGMGGLLALAYPGETLGRLTIPPDCIGIATVCSVTINGILVRHGIPVVSRYGGLLEIRNFKPVRFVELIEYKGTTLDPLEAFIAARMTKVREAARTGEGIIGASFREVPANARAAVKKLHTRMQAASLGGIFAIGEPHRPLCGIPVPDGRTGVITTAGLNPVAALQESGARIPLRSLASLEDYARFKPLRDVCRQYRRG